MKRTKMRVNQFLSAPVALFLAVSLGVPSPAGIYPELSRGTLRQAGLEENGAMSDFLNRLGVVAKSPAASIPAAGLEEPVHPLYWSTPRFVLNGHYKAISDLVFTPDGKSLVSAGLDGSVIHWDPTTGRSLFTAEGFSGQPDAVALSPDGKTAVFADETFRRIRLWNTETDQERPLSIFSDITQKTHTGRSRIVSLNFSHDGVNLSSVDDKGTMRLWNSVSGKLQFVLRSDKEWDTISWGFSPDGKYLVFADGLGPIQLLDPATGQVLGVLNHPVVNHVVPSLAFRPDGKVLAVGSGVGLVDLWDMTTRTSLPNQPNPMHPHGYTSALAFSPDGNTLAIGGPSGSIYLWDINSRHALFALIGQSGPTHVLTFSPDGKLLASAGEKGPVAVWDLDWIKEAAADRAEGQESLEKLVSFGSLFRKLRADQTPRAPFAERVKIAQVLQEAGLLTPLEMKEAFNQLPSAGSQQAALLAVYLYRVGAFSMEQLVDEFANLLDWEDLARKRGGTKNLMGLELHTSIPIDGPEGLVIQELLDMTMRVPGNLFDGGLLRIKTIFEDSGLEVQTLPSASPEVGTRILELWEKVAEAEGYKWSLLPTRLPVEWAWLHVSHNGRLTEPGTEAFLYRWVAHNAELAKKTGRSMRPAVSQGQYVAWLVRPPTKSKAKEGSGVRTEVTGEFYFPPEIAPNPWMTPTDPEVYRQYARDLIVDLSDMARAYRAAQKNPESWVAATADLPPQTVNSTSDDSYYYRHSKNREETLGKFYDSRAVPPTHPLDGPQVLRKLAQVLQDEQGITLVPSALSPMIENDPALVGQIDRFLKDREKLQAVRQTEQAVYPMGWGIDVEVSGDHATLSVPPAGPEPYGAYAGFVDRHLRPKVEWLNSPAILFREDGVYSFHRGSFLWNRIDDLWVPDGLWEFLRDRHLALALMVPTNHKEEWWKKLPLFLDPRTLRQRIPPHANAGSPNDPSPMDPPGTPLGSLLGYIGTTMIDPAQPDRVVPLSFIVRPAAGLEEKGTPRPRFWKRAVMGAALVFALGMLGFTLYQRATDPAYRVALKEGSPAKALDEYGTKIVAQGGDKRMVLILAMTGFPPEEPESALDHSPNQMKIVQSLSPLRFGPGILYHGRSGLDQAIRDGEIKGEIFFTRVGYRWATGAFDEESKDPAIFLMPTETFNRYMSQGKGILGIRGNRKEGFIDPYPEIRSAVPLSDFSEIWVAEDTYQRYRQMKDEKVKALLDQGKIKAVPGLRATLPPKGDPQRKEADPFDRVGMYVLERNLLKEIPAFEIIPGKAKPAGLEEEPRILELSLPELAVRPAAIQKIEDSIIQWISSLTDQIQVDPQKPVLLRVLPHFPEEAEILERLNVGLVSLWSPKDVLSRLEGYSDKESYSITVERDSEKLGSWRLIIPLRALVKMFGQTADRLVLRERLDATRSSLRPSFTTLLAQVHANRANAAVRQNLLKEARRLVHGGILQVESPVPALGIPDKEHLERFLKGTGISKGSVVSEKEAAEIQRRIAEHRQSVEFWKRKRSRRALLRDPDLLRQFQKDRGVLRSQLVGRLAQLFHPNLEKQPAIERAIQKLSPGWFLHQHLPTSADPAPSKERLLEELATEKARLESEIQKIAERSVRKEQPDISSQPLIDSFTQLNSALTQRDWTGVESAINGTLTDEMKSASFEWVALDGPLFNQMETFLRLLPQVFQSEPPDPPLRALRYLQMMTIRYLSDAGHLSDHLAIAFLQDAQSLQGELWSQRLKEMPLDPQTETLRRHSRQDIVLSAYTLLLLISGPQQFSNPQAHQWYLDATVSGFLTSMSSPRFGQVQFLAKDNISSKVGTILRELQNNNADELTQMKLAVLNREDPALRNLSIVYILSLTKTYQDFNVPRLKAETADLARVQIDMLSQRYPDYHLWNPFASLLGNQTSTTSGLEEGRVPARKVNVLMHSSAAGALSFVPDRWPLGKVTQLSENPQEANAGLEEAARQAASGQPVLVFVDAARRGGLVLPKQKLLMVIFVNPATLNRVDRRAAAASLERRELSLGLFLVDLTSGSVRIEELPEPALSEPLRQAA